jgi:hypothetical protein
VRSGTPLLVVLLAGFVSLAGALLLLTTGIERRRGAPAPGGAESAGLDFVERAAGTGGPAILRDAAAGRGGWPPSGAPRVELARPVFLGTIRPLGTELSTRDQTAFVAEVYRVRAVPAAAAAQEAELVMPPTLAAPPAPR